METKFCTYKNKEVLIEPKYQDIRDGREVIDTKKVGYHWHTCSEGPCAKCTKHPDIFKKIESQ